MAKTLIVAGFGPGISTSVARNFGSQGYSVALLSRTAAKLEAGVKGARERAVTRTRPVCSALMSSAAPPSPPPFKGAQGQAHRCFQHVIPDLSPLAVPYAPILHHLHPMAPSHDVIAL
jgi:NAD(P)-dependent dehydrogenase (short-subunit alcohol dehydrogenase family)